MMATWKERGTQAPVVGILKGEMLQEEKEEEKHKEPFFKSYKELTEALFKFCTIDEEM